MNFNPPLFRFRSVIYLPFLAVTVALCLTMIPAAHADRLIGGNLKGLLYEIDPQSGTLSSPVSVTPHDQWETLRVVKSVASHPSTGVIYAVVDEGSPNLLGTLDPATGEISEIGDTGDFGPSGKFTTITFGAAPDYPLYAIAGGSSSNGSIPGSIWTLNIETGEPTATNWTTAGVGGHALEFNPDNGMLYHFYNNSTAGGGTTGLEKINPATGVAEAVMLSGYSYGAVNGIVFRPDISRFYGFDNNNEVIFTIGSDGDVSLVNSVDFPVQALFYHNSKLYGAENDSFFEINLLMGERVNPMGLGRLVSKPSPIYAMATDPVSGTHYAITEAHDDFGSISEFASGLAKIDIDTGALTDRIRLEKGGLEGIAIDGNGQIYGVFGPDGPEPSFDNGTVVTVDKTTGAVTDTGWDTIQSNNINGQNLEYNPDDGLLYHLEPPFDHTSQSRLQTIDPNTGSVSSIIAFFDPFHRGIAYRGSNLFSIYRPGLSVTTFSSSGEIISIGEVVDDPTPTENPNGFFRSLLSAPDKVVPGPIQNANRALALAKLNRDIKKLKKKFKKAKKKGQRGKALKLKKKIKKLKKKIKTL